MPAAFTPEQVSVFSFSGIYEEQDFWRELPVGPDGSPFHFHDLTALPGTNGYLSDDAETAIRCQIDPIAPGGLHFIDSGNTHYMTKLFTDRIRQPFGLVLFDHHPDMQLPAFGGLLSCGSWLRAALEGNTALREVWLVGVDPGLLRTALAEADDSNALPPASTDTPFTLQFAGRPVHLLPGNRPTDAASFLPSADAPLPLYLSVDKDVLDASEITTNWDQGNMTAGTLFSSLLFLRDNTDLLGVDICGECSPSGLPGARSAAIRQNDIFNRKVLDIFLNSL
ncbi:MAG: arginase [Lachnospiraceae bacterium]|nr:arginase [Lachnospiraceae bacterium]